MEYIDQMNRSAAAARNRKEVPPGRVIVWVHNSHVVNMRSTGYASLGQISLGQLCREQFGNDGVFLIGMTSYEKTARVAHVIMWIDKVLAGKDRVKSWCSRKQRLIAMRMSFIQL